MAAKKNQAVAGSQNDSGIDIEETVSTADLVHIKGQVEKVKQKRNAKRQAQETRLKETARTIHARIEKEGAAYSKKAETQRSQRVANLTRQMEERFELEKAIAAKLEETQREFANLTSLVESVYTGRLKELHKANLPAPQLPQDE